MHARRYLLVLLIVLVVGLFATALTVSAQSDVCATITTQAGSAAGTACANQADGTTCVGSAPVSRTTSSGVVSSTYTEAGDTANLATTHVVSSGVLNTATSGYGLNILKPIGSSGVGLTYVVFGGATVTNVGGPGQAIWQNIALEAEPNLDPCAGISSLLLIQGPKGTTNTVTVNGAQFTLSSTVTARFLPGGILQICVLDGSITIGGVTVPPGSCVTAQLNAAGFVVAGSISAPEVIPPGELAAILALVGILPANILEYAIGGIVVNCPSGVGQANCTVSTGP